MKKTKNRLETPIEFTNSRGEAVRFHRLLTVKDVCELLSISRRTLERHLQQGRFMQPTLYIGKSPRWADLTLIDSLKPE